MMGPDPARQRHAHGKRRRGIQRRTLPPRRGFRPFQIIFAFFKDSASPFSQLSSATRVTTGGDSNCTRGSATNALTLFGRLRHAAQIHRIGFRAGDGANARLRSGDAQPARA